MPDSRSVCPWLCLSIAIVCLAVPTAQGATSCFSESCSISCSPDLPVEISTLVPASEFPPEGNTPIAFVDPNDGRNHRLIATQQGVILVWDGATQTILPTPFLDLRDNVGGPVQAGGEQGLLAMVAEPNYDVTGRLYIFYTRADNDIVIARYERSAADPDIGDPTGTTILIIDHPGASNHNGGWLAFGPDDFLYISTGDGGGGCDSNAGINGDGQRTDTLAGKMLRIDVLGTDPGGTAPDDCGVGAPGPYTIPTTNPFAGLEPDCDEVWAYGLRNPFRFSFDRDTGDLYIGDVGQNEWEEINMQAAATPAPVNFGWVCREGCESASTASGCSVTGCPADTGTTCEFPRPAGTLWDPILCHFNGGWDSIIGGYRYRGSFVPSIVGDYFYADVACGQIWKTTTLDPANPAAIDAACWSSGHGGIFSFAEDQLGELYIVNGVSSRIECIHNGEGCFWASAEVFSDGFEGENTDDWSSVQP